MSSEGSRGPALVLCVAIVVFSFGAVAAVVLVVLKQAGRI